MEKYIIGILGISSLMLAWVGVQSLWRSVFADHVRDRDVLAGRSDCGSCGCSSPCSLKHVKKQKD